MAARGSPARRVSALTWRHLPGLEFRNPTRAGPPSVEEPLRPVPGAASARGQVVVLGQLPRSPLARRRQLRGCLAHRTQHAAASRPPPAGPLLRGDTAPVFVVAPGPPRQSSDRSNRPSRHRGERGRTGGNHRTHVSSKRIRAHGLERNGSRAVARGRTRRPRVSRQVWGARRRAPLHDRGAEWRGRRVSRPRSRRFGWWSRRASTPGCTSSEKGRCVRSWNARPPEIESGSWIISKT